MPEIPDQVSLLWIAKFLGMAPAKIYKLNAEGHGPAVKFESGQYLVSKAALLLWLSTRKTD